jgi:hypothetical protein
MVMYPPSEEPGSIVSSTKQNTRIGTTRQTTVLKTMTTRGTEPNSAWVEEKGVRLSLNYSVQVFRVGEILNYTVELRNVNSSSRLYLTHSVGYIGYEIHNASGKVVDLPSGIYAWGPPGQPKEQFFKGSTWSVRIDSHPANLTPGNYTLVVKVRYGIIDPESRETIEISVPIGIIAS